MANETAPCPHPCCKPHGKRVTVQLPASATPEDVYRISAVLQTISGATWVVQ